MDNFWKRFIENLKIVMGILLVTAVWFGLPSVLMFLYPYPVVVIGAFVWILIGMVIFGTVMDVGKPIPLLPPKPRPMPNNHKPKPKHVGRMGQ